MSTPKYKNLFSQTWKKRVFTADIFVFDGVTCVASVSARVWIFYHPLPFDLLAIFSPFPSNKNTDCKQSKRGPTSLVTGRGGGGLSPPQHAMHDAFSAEHVVVSGVRASQGQGAGQGALMASEGAVCLQVFEG